MSLQVETNLNSLGSNGPRDASKDLKNFLNLVVWILAMALAYKCNKGKDGLWLRVIFAFLFPHVYLIQAGVRKYVLAEKGYCVGAL